MKGSGVKCARWSLRPFTLNTPSPGEKFFLAISFRYRVSSRLEDTTTGLKAIPFRHPTCFGTMSKSFLFVSISSPLSYHKWDEKRYPNDIAGKYLSSVPPLTRQFYNWGSWEWAIQEIPAPSPFYEPAMWAPNFRIRITCLLPAELNFLTNVDRSYED